MREISVQYAQSGDLAAAQASLDKLGVANAGQLLISLAEQDVAAGLSPEEIESTAKLAEALGARSQKVTAYLAPAAATPAQVAQATVAPTVLSATLEPAATAAPVVTEAPVKAPTATEAPTKTAAAPTSSPTPEPQNARVVADGAVNLRSGPGKAYPVVGSLGAGQEAAIVARNASGDWWQIEYSGARQAWVAGTVVRVLGAIDAVAVAQNIPAPPTAAPRPTAAPQPTASTETQPPAPSQPTAAAPSQPTVAPSQPPAAPQPPAANPGGSYAIQTVRLRSVGEAAQACNGGDHNIFVTVVDAGGAPVDGVRVREVWTNQIHVTGDKGPGRAEFDLYKDGGGQVQIVDEGNNALSDLTRSLSNMFPDFDMMKAAGYCNCKPHPDDASCESDIVNKQYLFAYGHYAYEVVFRRSW